MVNKGKTPIWNINKSESIDPVGWVDHRPNPRFAIYDPNLDSHGSIPSSLSDDLVLDKETGLVWSRSANPIGMKSWIDANTSCRLFALGSRIGWRLPSIEELSSLVDLNQADLALPTGHPFTNVQYGSGVNGYWSSTHHENEDMSAWFVNFWRKTEPHLVDVTSKDKMGYVWPVRGGVVRNY